MDQAARIAFIQSQVLCAYAQLEAMKAENAECVRAGRSLTFDTHHFSSVPDVYRLGHNDVLAYLRGDG